MKNFLVILTIFLTSLSIIAQSEDSIWLQSDNSEITFQIPANYTYFFDPVGFIYKKPSAFSEDKNSECNYKSAQIINGSNNKTVMSIEIYEVESPKTCLDLMIQKERVKNTKNIAAEKGFTIKQFVTNRIGNEDINQEMQFIASKTHIYIVSVANRGKRTSVFEQFLSSIKLNYTNQNITKLSSLKSFKIDDILEATSNKNINSIPTTTNKNQNKVNSLHIFFIHKPFPSYTKASSNPMVFGNINLKGTFDKNGSVSKIEIISGLHSDLNRNAFFSLLRFKFIPEELDNQFITVVKTIEFSFS